MKKSIAIDKKMTEIINWKTKEVIIEDSNLSKLELIQKAIKDGVSLAYADLKYADLRYADLSGADFYSASLWGANFQGSNLEGAQMEQHQVDDLLKSLGVEIV